MKALADCGNANWRKCVYCHKYDDPALMTHVKKPGWRYHKACAAAYQRQRNANRLLTAPEGTTP